MNRLWFLAALLCFACSKAQLPVTSETRTVLVVTAIDNSGTELDSTSVYLNGELAGVTPFRKEGVPAGLVALRLSKPGYQIFTKQLFVDEGQSYNVEALLQPLPPDEGQLIVTVNQDSAMVLVKDSNENIIIRSFDRTFTQMLRPGAYIVAAEKPGLQPVVKAVDVFAGQVTTVNLEFNITQTAIAPTLEFSASPDSLVFGEPVFLRWQSSGYQVVVDQGVGTRGPSGSEEVYFRNPGKKVFTATAYGEENLFTIATDSVYIKEAPMPALPVVMLSTTRTVEVNRPASITWVSQNAQYVVVDFVQNAGLQGSETVTFTTPGVRIVTATAFNQAGYTSATDTIEVVESEVTSVDDIVLAAESSVRADRGEAGYADPGAATFEIKKSGKYQILAEVWYNSGDSQLNESFYLELRDGSGKIKYPKDPNAGNAKVVPDDPGTPHTKTQNCGEFQLSVGTHAIDVYHYAKIANFYPQFVNDRIRGPESVKIIGFRVVFLD